MTAEPPIWADISLFSLPILTPPLLFTNGICQLSLPHHSIRDEIPIVLVDNRVVGSPNTLWTRGEPFHYDEMANDLQEIDRKTKGKVKDHELRACMGREYLMITSVAR